jgi:transposase
MANQLRVHLQTTLPGAIGLFRGIDSAIPWNFLARFPDPGQGRLALPGW